MRRIANRAWALWVIIGLLLGGVAFFLYEYFAYSGNWVMHTGNPHIYEEGKHVANGFIVDRDGNVLLNLSDKRTYTSDLPLRQATLHWLGDRYGYISAPAISHYAEQMTGFDVVGGIYHYGGAGGKTTLTLSSKAQKAALEAMGDHRGTVAVYNYKTGEILCAVTTPTYDPENVPDIDGDTTGAYSGVYVNRFTQSVYIPGSIFKLVTTAALLEEIDDIQDQTFTCSGSIEFGVDKVTCAYAHGTMNLKTALQHSCNCAFAQMAVQLGAEKLQAYVEKAGVMDPVTFDGITTAKGNFQAIGAANVELAWSAIGQHKDQMNPCAFLTFVGAIANGGEGVKPHIVKSVSAGDKMTYSAEPSRMERIMSEQTAQILEDLMRNNVVNNYGAGNFPGLTVCAKSGTGEVGGGREPNALFTGFVSDEAYPLAFIVVIEEGGYGQVAGVPVISKVLAACKEVMDS